MAYAKSDDFLTQCKPAVKKTCGQTAKKFILTFANDVCLLI